MFMDVYNLCACLCVCGYYFLAASKPRKIHNNGLTLFSSFRFLRRCEFLHGKNWTL